jgi:endonuclease I
VIAKKIKDLSGLNTDQKRLRDSIFEADIGAAGAISAAPARRTGMPSITQDGTITWSFPVEFSIRVPGLALPGVAAPAAPGAAPPPPPTAAPSAKFAQKRKQIDDQRKLVDAAFAEAAKKKYFDKAADTAASKAYYSGIAAKLSAKKRYQSLQGLLKKTHKKILPYKPAIYLYPWVDLQPGDTSPSKAKVRSIYSGLIFSARDFANEDLQIELQRLEMAERLVREGAFSEDAVFESSVLEATAPFNCEHVVPQSWFQKRNPMRGDLHHLFSCESNCNSFRGNTPYFDFPDFEEVIRTNCGKREEDGFEPTNGKGEVARSTLYFLIRYPGQIAAGRFTEARLPLLIQWHKDHKVTDHERHRNMAIFEAQGNRNPLIDHPEWADSIDFNLGLTSSPIDEAFPTDDELMAGPINLAKVSSSA